jgi:hypothetical protein
MLDDQGQNQGYWKPCLTNQRMISSQLRCQGGSPRAWWRRRVRRVRQMVDCTLHGGTSVPPSGLGPQASGLRFHQSPDPSQAPMHNCDMSRTKLRLRKCYNNKEADVETKQTQKLPAKTRRSTFGCVPPTFKYPCELTPNWFLSAFNSHGDRE